MTAQAKTKTTVSYIWKDGSHNYFRGFDALNNLDRETAFPVAIARTIEIEKEMPAEAIGFCVLHSDSTRIPDSPTHTWRKYYFAHCAADVLSPQTAQRLAKRLQKISGEDLLSSQVRAHAEFLEEAVLNNPHRAAFVLVEDSATNPGCIMIDADNYALNRITGEIYFPFPKRSRKAKASVSAKTPKQSG